MRLPWGAAACVVVVTLWVPTSASPLGQLDAADTISGAEPRASHTSWEHDAPLEAREMDMTASDADKWVWSTSEESSKDDSPTKVSQSRNLFTSLIAPFMGGRQRPRGNHRGREKPKPAVWRPGYTRHPPRRPASVPTPYHPPGVAPHLVQSDIRRPPHFVPEQFLGDYFGDLDAEQPIADANSISSVNIDPSDFSFPRDEDVYVNDGNNFPQDTGSFIPVSLANKPSIHLPTSFQPPPEVSESEILTSTYPSSENVGINDFMLPPPVNGHSQIIKDTDKFSQPFVPSPNTLNSLNIEKENLFITGDPPASNNKDEGQSFTPSQHVQQHLLQPGESKPQQPSPEQREPQIISSPFEPSQPEEQSSISPLPQPQALLSPPQHQPHSLSSIRPASQDSQQGSSPTLPTQNQLYFSTSQSTSQQHQQSQPQHHQSQPQQQQSQPQHHQSQPQQQQSQPQHHQSQPQQQQSQPQHHQSQPQQQQSQPQHHQSQPQQQQSQPQHHQSQPQQQQSQPQQHQSPSHQSQPEQQQLQAQQQQSQPQQHQSQPQQQQQSHPQQQQLNPQQHQLQPHQQQLNLHKHESQTQQHQSQQQQHQSQLRQSQPQHQSLTTSKDESLTSPLTSQTSHDSQQFPVTYLPKTPEITTPQGISGSKPTKRQTPSEFRQESAFSQDLNHMLNNSFEQLSQPLLSQNQNHPFDPLPGINKEVLGPPGSTTEGFLPFESSDEFFDQIFAKSNPFGEKIVAVVTAITPAPHQQPEARANPSQSTPAGISSLTIGPTFQTLSFSESISGTLSPSYQTSSSSSAVFHQPSVISISTSSSPEGRSTWSANDITSSSPIQGPWRPHSEGSTGELESVTVPFTVGGDNPHPNTTSPFHDILQPGGISDFISLSSTSGDDQRGREKPITDASTVLDDFDVIVLPYKTMEENKKQIPGTQDVTGRPDQSKEDVSVYLVRRQRPEGADGPNAAARDHGHPSDPSSTSHVMDKVTSQHQVTSQPQMTSQHQGASQPQFSSQNQVISQIQDTSFKRDLEHELFPTSGEKIEEFMQVLGSLAPPPSSFCEHGFCQDHSHDNNAWQDHLVRASRDAAVFTYSELHSPANDSFFYRPSRPHDRYVCEADVRQQRPAWGRATDGNFLRIINTDTFPQMIRMEVCRLSGERCSFVPEAVTSTCRQRYGIHKMAAVDPQAPANGAFLAAFKVPSGCFCHVSHNTGTNTQQPSANTSPGTTPLGGATIVANSSSGANNINGSFIGEQNVKSSETSRFTRNQNSGVDSFTGTHSAGQQNEVFSGQQPNQDQWWQQRQQQQLGDSSSSIHIGRQNSVVSTHHQPSLLSSAPTARQVLGSPSPMLPLATFHRHTSITISQPSTMNTGSPAPSAQTFGSLTPTVAFPITPLISTTPQTPTSTTTTFSPVISTTSFVPAISTTTFSTPMPTSHLVQTFTENSGGFIESQLISANTQNQNNNQHFSISSADFTSQENTDKTPRDIISEGLREIDGLSVEDDMQVSKTSDNNFILSLRQVKSDGTVVPLDLVINVDGRLVSAASKFASGATLTAERRHDVDQISVDLQELPLNVKNYLSTLQNKVQDIKTTKINHSHHQDESKEYPDQLPLATLSNQSIDSLVVNSQYTKTVPSIEIDTPKISSIHHITNSHHSGSKLSPSQNELTPIIAKQGTTSVAHTPSNLHVTRNTFTQAQRNLSPGDEYLEFTDLSDNTVSNSIGASTRIKPNTEIKYLNSSQSFTTLHQTPLHQTHIHQPQTTSHPVGHQISTPGFRSLASSLGQNHQTRQISLNEESIFIGNKSRRVFSQTEQNPFLSTKMYPDRPHVIQNYFIQVPDGLTDDVSMLDMMGSASQQVHTSAGLGTGTVSTNDGDARTGGTLAQSDGKVLPEAVERLKNHRMTPISSHYSILPPPALKSNSSSMLPSGLVLESLLQDKRKRKSLSISELKKHISATSARITRDTAAVTRARRTRDTTRHSDERKVVISSHRSLKNLQKAQSTEMVSSDFASRRDRAAGINPIRGGRATGINFNRRGRATGIDFIRGVRATGIDSIRGKATGIDSIRGKATGIDSIRGRTTGINPNGNPKSLSSENKDVHVNIHLNFAPEPQSMNTTPDRLVISGNSHNPQKLDPSQYYAFSFNQPSDTYDSVNYNRENTQYFTHLLANRQVPNPWKTYPSTSKPTALVGNWPYSTLQNNHEIMKTFPSDSTGQGTISLPKMEHSLLLNKYFSDLPMKQTPHTSNQNLNTPLCVSCQSHISSPAAWSGPWSSQALRPARHIALQDEASRSEVTLSSVQRPDVTVPFKGHRMSLGPHRVSLPRPRPARRTVFHFPGKASYRPLVHETIRVPTREPRTLREFIMSPSPHPGVIVPHQRDKSSWKL